MTGIEQIYRFYEFSVNTMRVEIEFQTYHGNRSMLLCGDNVRRRH